MRTSICLRAWAIRSSYWPNALMMNNGDETFIDHAKAEAIEPPPGGIYQEKSINRPTGSRSSRCAAVADFTSHGRLDIIVNNFNDYPYYFRNQFPRSKLRRVPSCGNQKQPRRYRRRGQIARHEVDPDAASTSRRWLPRPIFADAPFRPGTPPAH